MKTHDLKIEGMSCGHCVMSVKKELSKLDGVLVQNVQIGSAQVQVDEQKVGEQDLRKAVDEAGYMVVAIQ